MSSPFIRAVRAAALFALASCTEPSIPTAKSPPVPTLRATLGDGGIGTRLEGTVAQV